MVIVVTGAAGFIGQEVASRLIDRGHAPVLVDFWDAQVSRFEEMHASILPSVYRTFSRAERVLRPEEFLKWLGEGYRPDAIVHLGAVVDTTDMGQSGDLFYRNVDYTRRLVEACNRNPTSLVPGIVFASSAAVYGARGFPNNPYGLSKALAERALMESRGELAILRFFNVFGANEDHKGAMASMPFKIAQAYRKGTLIDVHSLDAARDFVPVTTVAEKVVAYAEMLTRDHDEPTHREIEDLGTGFATTFRDLDNYIMQATNNLRTHVLEVQIPPSVVGRYQDYTCAGIKARNCGLGSPSTREGIEEIYGKR